MSKVVLSLGFSKKPANKAIKANALKTDKEDEQFGKVKIDFIKRVDGKGIETGDPEKAAAILTIPLTQDPWAKPSAQSAEDEAVAAILGEASATSGGDGVPVKAIQPIPGINNVDPSDPKRPILQAAMIPGLDECKDDTEKFKHDIAIRADDIQASSECYSSVPIGNFGEALLRGMGWDGSRLETEQALNQARPQRLGLGAKVRPPSPPSKLKNKNKKPTEAQKAAGDEWAKEAAQKVAQQRLEVGKIVWLKDSRFVKQGDVSRARVLKTSGVPGCNKIEIELEDSGDTVTVARADAVLVDAEELIEKPFVEAEKKPPQQQQQQQQKKRELPEKAVGESHQKRPRGGDDKASSSSSSSSSSKSWVIPGIRIRIIREGKYYREKADVVEVSRDGAVSVKLDGSGGKRVHELAERDLETVVPSVGDKIRCVRGEHRRRKFVVLKKDRDREEVCVEADGRKVYLKFGDVSARAD